MPDAQPITASATTDLHADRRRIIYPEDQTLSFAQNVGAGLQHVLAMFGGTVVVPLLIGFDSNVAILFSGIATLLFWIILRGQIPSYLGSSFSFVGAVIAATAYQGSGANPHIDIALTGIVVTGFLYAVFGIVVWIIGPRFIEILLPPPVTGAIVAIIGLNLASVSVRDISADALAQAAGLLTILSVACFAVFLRGLWQRFSILIGLLAAYVIYYLLANAGLGALLGIPAASPIAFSAVWNAPLVGVPTGFHHPALTWQAIATALTVMAPVTLVLVAENLGHVKAIGGLIGREEMFNGLLGRAFFADGVATMLSGSFGGTGVTTYAENMGVMQTTRNFSSRTFVAAGVIAILLGFSPMFGALLRTIPTPVVGGISFVLFGIIIMAGARLWIVNKVDFSDTRNAIPVGVALVIGAGDLKVTVAQFEFGGIAAATFAAIILYHLLHLARDGDTGEHPRTTARDRDAAT